MCSCIAWFDIMLDMDTSFLQDSCIQRSLCSLLYRGANIRAMFMPQLHNNLNAGKADLLDYLPVCVNPAQSPVDVGQQTSVRK